MIKSKRKFTYCYFLDGLDLFSYCFDSEKYTKDEAVKITKEETEWENVEVNEEKLIWVPRLPDELIDTFEEQHGGYMYSKDCHTTKGFKVWEVGDIVYSNYFTEENVNKILDKFTKKELVKYYFRLPVD